MSLPYEEIVEGETYLRLPPSLRHEAICQRLHELISVSLQANASLRLLDSRSIVQLSAGTIVRPDVAVVSHPSKKIWLAVEVISSEDHHTDTVVKKGIYEDANLTRLWMVDPRYDNVEVYHGSPYGMVLRHILAGSDLLQEEQFPGLQISITHLFRA
ncbi:MAG TPA: Uma2 family endonuclease [Candidatus Paceibacterota bacterium]|nr:Uma2 family endonuclease [Verrucomicrobiota bacterium]HRY47129.1 Uma2 family endonuclease [Candidatus Paceibacterota bacterium]